MKVSLPGGSLEAHLPARPGAPAGRMAAPAPVSSGVKVQCQPLPRTQRSVPQGRGSVNSARMMGLEPHPEEGCR